MFTRKRLILVGIVLVAIGIAGLVTAFSMLNKPTKIPESNISAPVIESPVSDKPKPEEIAEYTVAPDLPKFISIPKLDITNARVFSLGLKNGEIATPSNIHDAGWYKNSAKPGESGAMFMYGHRSSWESEGLFRNLSKLKSGDTFTITKGDNEVLTYKVVTSKTYKKDDVDMNEVLAPINESKSGLNLMTCVGEVIEGTNDFTERLIVFAVQQ